MAHKVILTSERFGGYSLTEVRRNGRSALIQEDYGFPSLARALGWSMRGRSCAHDGTDGTIACPDCGKPVSAFISAAAAFLDARDGKIFLDVNGLVGSA